MMSRIDRYVKKAVKTGMKPKDIEKKLTKIGFKKRYIDSLIDKYKNSRSFNINMKIVSSVAAIFILLLVIILIPKDAVKDCKDDLDCFTRHANECKEAVIFSEIEGTVFKITSSKDCTIIKKVESLASDEPTEIIDLLQDKEMVCTYEMGYFNPDFATTISGGLESCTGELRDTIEELMIALYDIQ